MIAQDSGSLTVSFVSRGRRSACGQTGSNLLLDPKAGIRCHGQPERPDKHQAGPPLGIDVALVDENQVELEAIGDPQNHLAKLVISGEWLNMEGSVCLRFVDAYGLTIFNQAQLPVLVSELQRTASLQTNPEIRSHIQEVCRVVSASRGIHMYVKFIGD